MNRAAVRIALLAATALVAAHGAWAAPGDQVFGVWLTQSKDGTVRIAPCAANPAETCGVVLSGKGPKGEDARTLTDIKNPEPALRTRPIIGLQVISSFHRGGGGWTGGRIYDPNDGRTYKAKMQSGGSNLLKVAGCVLFFCRSETWTRVQ
jgi:uncharacterized protein (DUF2147 family)